MPLSPSTIGLYVDRLIAEGILREGQKDRSNPGRPPTFLELNPHLGEFVGIDFEARQISAASIYFSQDLLRTAAGRESNFPTPPTMSSGRSSGQFPT